MTISYIPMGHFLRLVPASGKAYLAKAIGDCGRWQGFETESGDIVQVHPETHVTLVGDVYEIA